MRDKGTYKNYGVHLNRNNPSEARAIDFIEDYIAADRRNNFRYLLIDLIEYKTRQQSVIENTPTENSQGINELTRLINADFEELFRWLSQLPEFMKELKKQLVAEVAHAITENGGQISFHQLPEPNERSRRELDEKSRRQQKQINDLLNLE